MVDIDQIRKLLERHFNSYTVAPILDGAGESVKYKITVNGNENFILKIQRAGLQNEYLNYKWLKGKLPVPDIIFFSCEKEFEAICLTEVKGKTLEKYMGLWTPEKVVEQYALSLKKMHSLTIDKYALKQNLQNRIAAAKYNLKNGKVDKDNLQPENQSEDISELFKTLLSLVPTNHEPVFTHGDFCFDNIIFNDTQISGYIDLANGGVADKYQDIGLAVRNINETFGSGYVSLFFSRYGLDKINEDKIKFYILLDEFF